ncbi:hypothetical protein [Agrobacterium pusense]|uniref:hypothetical protein n=1 Tax=Agrobacterium pusense TaxID=648995 RepID=UPI000D1B7D12|nr:hypothetical protein [Agrobacterium pusense]
MTDKEIVNTINIDPPTGRQIEIYDVCIWLLRVLDRKGKRLPFVASVFDFYLKRGALSEKQSDALQSIFDNTVEMYERNALGCQGMIATDDGSETKVVSLSSARKRK